jgi:Gpi18-like mannosyltransferase
LSRGSPLPAALLFALSLLVRETGVVAIGCVLIAMTWSGRRPEAILVALLAGCVLLTWRLYVAWILFPDWGLDGLWFHPPDFAWPFAGVRDLWQHIAHGQYYSGVPELSRAGIAYPVVLIGGLVLAAILAVTVRTPTSVAALIYAILAICLNFGWIWVHVGNGQRGTYELFLMLALSCVSIRTLPRFLQRGLTMFWLCAAAYVFLLAFDAAYVRSALGIPF